jgi:putative superfamily III holin-X
MAEQASKQRTTVGTGSLADEIAQLVEREVDGVAATLRAEFERLQSEALGRARDAAGGAAYLGAAGGVGLVAAGAVASLPLLLLRKLLPGWLVAVLVAIAAAAGATALGRRGLERIADAAPDSAAMRLEQAKERVVEVVRTRAAELFPI